MDQWEDLIAGMPVSNGSRYYRACPVRIGIVCDRLFFDSVSAAAEFVPIRSECWESDVEGCDVLWVVSAWHGFFDDWGGLANPQGEKGALLCRLMDRCRAKGIPVFFHSKEDPPSYAQFLEYARHADFVSTSALEKIDDYRRDCGTDEVRCLRFCINPLCHNPIGSRFRLKSRDVVFSGTWYQKFPDRCRVQEMLLDGVIASGRGLRIIDRASAVRNGARFRYPEKYGLYLLPALELNRLRLVHRLFDWAVNVNSITASETMFANRAYELQAMGNLMISNRSKGMQKTFPGIFVAETEADVADILDSCSDETVRRFQASGIRRVMTGETCYDRIGELLAVAGFSRPDPSCHVLVLAERLTERIRRQFEEQSYADRELMALGDLTPEAYARADAIAFFGDRPEYGRFYLQDMIDAFKYADVDYVTKGAHYESGVLVPGPEHDYVSHLESRECTVFWRAAFERERLMTVTGPCDLPHGYAAGAGEYDVLPLAGEAMTSPPLLSIIIPAHNAQRTIGKCLESVLGQSAFRDLEVVCIDDGSTDHTIAEFDRWRSRDSRMSVVRQANGGPGAARNAGIERATGKYLMFLDADDMLFSGEVLSRAVSIAERTGCDILCATADKTDATGYRNGGRMAWMLQRHLLPSGDVFRGEDVGVNLFFAFGPVPWAKLFRRDFVLENQLLFPLLRRSEDFAFVQLALSLGRISVLGESLVLHRTGISKSLESTKDETPLAFCDGERFLLEQLERRNVTQVIKTAAYRRAIARLNYNLQAMRTAVGAESIFHAVQKEYGRLREAAGECMVPEFLAARVCLDSMFSHESMWDFFRTEYRNTCNRLMESRRDCDRLKSELSVVEGKLRRAQSDFKREVRETVALKTSAAYRVGMFVTWPARRAYRMFKCYRENGLKYALRKLILGKECEPDRDCPC